jgi:hypothetical protein
MWYDADIDAVMSARQAADPAGPRPPGEALGFGLDRCRPSR